MTCNHCGKLKCKCVARDGETVRVSITMVDTQRFAPIAGLERKPLHMMMTDSEKRTMRDSVPGMSVVAAAKLPIYDDVRGLIMNSMPADEYWAIVDGAGQGSAFHKAQAALDHAREQYDARLSGRDNRRSYADDKDNGQAGYEQRLRDAWRHG